MRMTVTKKSAAFVFGTMVELALSAATASDAEEAGAAVLEDFDRLHWKLHAWKSGDLVELNRAVAAGTRRLKVDREMAAVISEATRLSIRSAGLFNPAIGRLVGLWNFHDDEPRATRPHRPQLDGLRDARPQMTDLIVHGDELECLNPSVQLDFGGYAKGYALDRAARVLKERGIEDALINVGGHIMALGQCRDRPWSVALREPRRAGLLARLELRDGEAVSTSGDYERFFVMDGKRYAHIMDPRTGFPAADAQAAVILASPSAHAGALSDAASGAVFVAGRTGWLDAISRMGTPQAMLIDGEGRLHVTDELRGRLEFAQNGRPQP